MINKPVESDRRLEVLFPRRGVVQVWFDLCQRPPHYSLSAAHFAFPMHILNADVLSSILFSWCKSKLANIINTEKLLVCLQFAYIGRFFFKTQIDQLPEEMHSMALAKNSGWEGV